MNRAIFTAIEVWRKRSLIWPLKAASALLANRVRGLPAGLSVEPSGNGAEKHLSPDSLIQWLYARPAGPGGIHFTGRSSDPLTSPYLDELACIAASNSPLVSVSTDGLHLSDDHLGMPVDRWVLFTPAATGSTWKELRGTDDFHSFKGAVDRLVRNRNGMVEMVLTIWKGSAGDLESFRELATELNVHLATAVYGRYQPGITPEPDTSGKGSPYILDEKGNVRLRHKSSCPMTGTLFLDCQGALHPCRFSTGIGPGLTIPCEASWQMAARWNGFKASGKLTPCSRCFISE